MRKCPVCSKPINVQSVKDACGWDPDQYCLEIASYSNDRRKFNHYIESPVIGTISIHLPPYRIQLESDGTTKIGIHSRYKTKRGMTTDSGDFYFKTILKTDAHIHPDTEDKMRNRIKLLLIMS